MRTIYKTADVLNQIEESAEKIKNYYKSYLNKVNFVIIPKGGLFYGTRLAKILNVPQKRIGYLWLNSYEGEEQGPIRHTGEDVPLELISGKDIVLIDDILDKRKTSKRALDHLNLKGPKSIKIASLFDKSEEIEKGLEWINSDFGSLHIEGKPWVGCSGLDFDFAEEESRELDFLAALEEEDKKKSPQELREELFALYAKQLKEH